MFFEGVLFGVVGGSDGCIGSLWCSGLVAIVIAVDLFFVVGVMCLKRGGSEALRVWWVLSVTT